jgi:hypothetical protein
LARLEAEGARILVDKCAALTAWTTCSLRIIYPHDPELNPIYKVEVISSVEQLATLTFDHQAFVAGADRLSSDVAAGKIPASLKIEVTGELPPSQ